MISQALLVSKKEWATLTDEQWDKLSIKFVGFIDWNPFKSKSTFKNQRALTDKGIPVVVQDNEDLIPADFKQCGYCGSFVDGRKCIVCGAPQSQDA